MARPVSQGSHVTTARGAQQFGSTELARIAAQNTGTWAGTLAAVRAAFPSLPLGQAAKAASLGYQRAQAIGQALAGPLNRPIPLALGQRAGSQFRTTGQVVPFRYVFFAGWLDPRTGRPMSYRNVHDSNTNLTRQQLIDAIKRQVKAYAANPEDESPDRPQQPRPAQLQDADITVQLLTFTYI